MPQEMVGCALTHKWRIAIPAPAIAASEAAAAPAEVAANPADVAAAPDCVVALPAEAKAAAASVATVPADVAAAPACVVAVDADVDADVADVWHCVLIVLHWIFVCSASFFASNASSLYCFANDPSVNVNVSLVKVILEFTNATEVLLTIVKFF